MKKVTNFRNNLSKVVTHSQKIHFLKLFELDPKQFSVTVIVAQSSIK